MPFVSVGGGGGGEGDGDPFINPSIPLMIFVPKLPPPLSLPPLLPTASGGDDIGWAEPQNPGPAVMLRTGLGNPFAGTAPSPPLR